MHFSRRSRRDSGRRADRAGSPGRRIEYGVEQLESRAMLSAHPLTEQHQPPQPLRGASADAPPCQRGTPAAGKGTTFSVPGAPTGLTATAGPGRVTLAWTAPANTGGAPRLCYAVQMSIDGGTTWTTIRERFAEPKAMIPCLKTGTAHTFRVAAVSPAGQGGFSAPSAPVTPTALTTPGKPGGPDKRPAQAPGDGSGKQGGCDRPKPPPAPPTTTPPANPGTPPQPRGPGGPQAGPGTPVLPPKPGTTSGTSGASGQPTFGRR